MKQHLQNIPVVIRLDCIRIYPYIIHIKLADWEQNPS